VQRAGGGGSGEQEAPAACAAGLGGGLDGAVEPERVGGSAGGGGTRIGAAEGEGRDEREDGTQ
jgi:hypothetical protein